jgi:ABC-type Fe3+-hydroxamate transport system substrate-binding protein
VVVVRHRRRFAPWLLILLIGLVACGTAPVATPTGTPATPPFAATASRAASTAPSTPGRTITPALGVSATAIQRGAASPSAAATAARTAYPLTIQDIAGRRVTLARRPERIVSLAPSTTETLFALGLGERVVGVDQSSDYPAAARDKPRIGTFSQPSIEVVVAQSPDLVVAANLHLRAAVPALEARGLTVVVLNPADLAAILDSITLVGQLTDTADAARRLRGDLERRIAAVEGRLRRDHGKVRRGGADLPDRQSDRSGGWEQYRRRARHAVSHPGG